MKKNPVVSLEPYNRLSQLIIHAAQNHHDALGLSEKNPIILNGNLRCLSFPSAYLALQPGGFVQLKGLTAKSLLVCYVCFEISCMFILIGSTTL